MNLNSIDNGLGPRPQNDRLRHRAHNGRHSLVQAGATELVSTEIAKAGLQGDADRLSIGQNGLTMVLWQHMMDAVASRDSDRRREIGVAWTVIETD